MRKTITLLAFVAAVWATVLWGIYEIARPIFWPVLTALEAAQ